MRSSVVLFLVFSLIIVSLDKALCQTPGKKEQDIERVVVGTNEVVLDAVVKDKKGRVIKDLTAADFEVSEDGVRQEVRSFRLIMREPVNRPNADLGSDNSKPGARKNTQDESTTTPVSSRPATLLKGSTHFGALALVFDRLSPNARSIARKASLSYVDSMRGDDFIGVFGIDLSLRVLQRFTNNENKIKTAVEKGLSHSSSDYASAIDQISDLQNQQAGLQSQVDTGTQGAGAGNDPSAAMGSVAAQQQFNAM